MTITLTDKDIKLKEKDGMWSYRMNGDIYVENIPSKEEALKDACRKAKIILRGKLKKK